MRFGVALPTQIPETTPKEFQGFLERAERHGFDSVWALDRLVYGGVSSLSLLAWAAGQSQKVRLGTAVLLGTLYSPLILAKEVATIDRLSQGRVILGMGTGNRADDYQAAGVSMERRGVRMSETVRLLRQAWSGQPIRHAGRAFNVDVGPIGPRPGRESGPPIWLGGADPRAMRRAARLADGYISGGGGLPLARKNVPAMREVLKAQGRDPNAFPCSCLLYYGMADDLDRSAAQVESLLQRYYGRLIFDPKQNALLGPKGEAVKRLREFEELNLDTVICVPTSNDPEQVDRLAEVVREVLGAGR